MKAYYKTPTVRLFQGDCIEVMRNIPDASINAAARLAAVEKE